MKKILSAFVIMVALILMILFLPRRIDNGVLIDCNGSYSTLYMDGSIKKINYNLNFPKFTVLSFKYNAIKAYDVKVVQPINDRVMIKQPSSYDLETLGNTALANTTYYYKIDHNNNISLVKENDLLVGKGNIKSFKDSNGKLSIFFIYPNDFSTMRVAISTTNFSSIYHDKINIKCSTGSKLYCIKENFSMDLAKGTKIQIEKNGNNLKVSVNNITKTFKDRVYINGNNTYITSIKRGSPSFSPAYNGTLEFTPSSKGITIINETTIEDYLCKVVPSEMPVSGGLEALKCQAIAARTYAISDMLGNRFASLGFYVDDSTQSQVYNNTHTQTISNNAVNSTKGLVMTYKNQPIDAKYYSTSCGLGAAYSDIWFKSDGSSENKPYLSEGSYLSSSTPLPKTEGDWLNFYKNTSLPSIDDISVYYRWHVSLSSEALTKSLNKSLKAIYESRNDYLTIKEGNKTLNKLPELKALKDIKIVKRSGGGNIIEIAFIFDNVTVDLREDYNIRSAIRFNPDYTDEAVSVISYKDRPIKNNTYLPSSFFAVDKSSAEFTFYGGGFGHGVGMSQYGAISLAKSGKTYTDILTLYYKGVSIEKFSE